MRLMQHVTVFANIHDKGACNLYLFAPFSVTVSVRYTEINTCIVYIYMYIYIYIHTLYTIATYAIAVQQKGTILFSQEMNHPSMVKILPLTNSLIVSNMNAWLKELNLKCCVEIC